MKKLFIISLSAFLFACKESNKENKTGDSPTATAEQTNPASTDAPPPPTGSSSNTTIIVEGKEIKQNGSILVDKENKNLNAGTPYRGMITTSSGPDDEGLVIRFVFDTKPGTYPLTGINYSRGNGDNVQLFAATMGGEEKIYGSNIIITECKDLGDNGAGGHKWSIDGIIENLTVPAMGIMLMDKEKKHPKEIKIDKVSFTGITFDDNADEMLNKALEMLDKKK